MTNYTTLKGDLLPPTIIDIVWGEFITLVAAAVGCYATLVLGSLIAV